MDGSPLVAGWPVTGGQSGAVLDFFEKKRSLIGH